jgi:hypothetical protein
MLAGMRYLESTCPVEVEYGQRLVDDLDPIGLVDVAAEGRCAIVAAALRQPPTSYGSCWRSCEKGYWQATGSTKKNSTWLWRPSKTPL